METPTQPNTLAQAQPQVKQGGAIGGWICFGLGILTMFFSLWAFIVYVPLFLAAFILAIVAMSQKRISAGITLLLATILAPLLLGLVLGMNRTKDTLENTAHKLERANENLNRINQQR